MGKRPGKTVFSPPFLVPGTQTSGKRGSLLKKERFCFYEIFPRKAFPTASVP